MSTKAPAYGERIEVRALCGWLPSVVRNSYPPHDQFLASFVGESLHQFYLRCDREGTSWRRVKKEET